MTAGRPTKYKKKYCQEMLEFFDVEDLVLDHNGENMIANRLPTIAGFARKIGISRQRLYEWGQKYPEFQDTMQKCLTIQEEIMINNGLRGFYSSGFAQLAMKNMHKWKDRAESSTTSENININIDKQDVGL